MTTFSVYRSKFTHCCRLSCCISVVIIVVLLFCILLMPLSVSRIGSSHFGDVTVERVLCLALIPLNPTPEQTSERCTWAAPATGVSVSGESNVCFASAGVYYCEVIHWSSLTDDTIILCFRQHFGINTLMYVNNLAVKRTIVNISS